jgi:hypothetical protein
MTQSSIRKQLRLPLQVALEVVLQGIRIRMGRSMVTLLGVAFGIAFLMAMLTGQVIRTGVSRETEIRDELDRRVSFLTAKTGPVRDAVFGVIQTGTLNDIERRFVRRLVREGAARLQWCGGGDSPLEELDAVVEADNPDAAARGATALLIAGNGEAPDADWDRLAGLTRQGAIALLRDDAAFAGRAGAVVSLARELRPDEQARRIEQQRRDRTRTIWIVVIALLVTVIGISNAMLMSVTERFREIGTMKCLGALSGFVRQMFFIESSLLGFVGSVAGVLLGAAFSITAFAATYGFGLVLASLDGGRVAAYAALSIAAGVLLSVVAAIYPASFASRMVPATALRSTI